VTGSDSDALVNANPAGGIAFSLFLITLAIIVWVTYERYENVYRRVPGTYGRISATLFLAGIGFVGFITSILSMIS
jgi:hypothetical protein